MSQLARAAEIRSHDWVRDALCAYDSCACIVAGGDCGVPVLVEDRIRSITGACQARIINTRRSDIDPSASGHGLHAIEHGITFIDGRPRHLREEIQRRGAASMRMTSR